MSTPILNKAYNAAAFKEQGDHLVALLAQHLSETTTGESDKVIRWSTPEEEYAHWQRVLEEGISTDSFFEEVLSRSIHVHHPKYIGHQVAPTVPVSALATLLSAQLNNGMAVYEMGQASTAIERLVIEKFTKRLKWDVGNGFLTSGGTLANLTALLAARKAKVKGDVWNNGHHTKLAILVSEEAHYCVDRAARIMGLGDLGIVKVPTGSNYKMRVDLLPDFLTGAQENGLEVIAIVGSAPSTSTGIHDDLEAISTFAKAYDLWFHIDAAHGGGALFSQDYYNLMRGCNLADSMIIDGHKMMGTSSITTAVLFKNTADSYATFSQKAQYLWEQHDDPEWFNMAKRTFECTKSMMSLRFMAIWNAYGDAFFNDYVNVTYNAAQNFGKIIKESKDFELALVPESNIVCFRYTGGLYPVEFESVNRHIRQQLLEDGIFYIVATQLKAGYFLRTTFMNPFTTEAHTLQLLDSIRAIAKNQ